MELSRRIHGIVEGADDGWGIHYRAQALRRGGEEVTLLTVGDHDFGMAPELTAAIKAALDAGHTGYCPVAGTPELRDAVARRITARHHVGATRGNVIITTGGQGALFMAMCAVLDPGQSCIVLDPYYATFPQTVRAAGGRPIVVPCPAEQGFQPDVEAIAAALAPDTRAILVNSPNNPTGVVYDPARMAALAALCRERDLWLISDELYECLVHEGVHASPRDLPGMAARTLVVGSLSKSHAMTGSRIGWLVGPEAVIVRLADLATATTYGLPGYIQDAGVVALERGEEIEHAIARRYRERARRAVEILAGARGCRVVPPAGGMYVMLDLRPTGLSGVAFAERLLEEERIAVMPGESFGSAAAGHVRVALTLPEPALEGALCRLAAFVERFV